MKVKNKEKKKEGGAVQAVVRAGDVQDSGVSDKKQVKKTAQKKCTHKHQHHKCQTPALRRKVQNLMSICIFLVGALAGSLFVDVAQFFTERGLSAKALGEARVVSYDGATWVRYAEEKIPVDVFVSTALQDEDRQRVDAALSALAVFMPTVQARLYDVGTDAGKERASQVGVAFVPALHFGAALSDHPYYDDAAEIFVPRSDGTYALRPGALDLEAVEYIDTPQTDRGLIIGKIDAPHTVTIFEDVLCDGCDARHRALTALQAKHADVFSLVYKHVPSEGSEASRTGALAAHCAYEQGFYERYMQILYTNSAWKVVDPSVRQELFVQYAGYITGFDQDAFKACYTQRRYEGEIVADITEADYFGVQSEGQIFIDGKNYGGNIADISALGKALQNEFSL